MNTDRQGLRRQLREWDSPHPDQVIEHCYLKWGTQFAKHTDRGVERLDYGLNRRDFYLEPSRGSDAEGVDEQQDAESPENSCTATEWRGLAFRGCEIVRVARFVHGTRVPFGRVHPLID